MNEKSSLFLKNIFHSMTTNVLTVMITFSLTLFLPKYLGIKNYSYWQLYLFYLTYISYSSIGWCEGTHLKYGGEDYEKLPKSKMASQFFILALYQIIVCIGGSLVISVFVKSEEKKWILIMAFISAALNILRYLLQMTLQAVNKIKEYAKIATGERILFFLLVLFLLMDGAVNYLNYILAEIVARGILLFYAMYLCKDIVFVKLDKPKDIWKESKEIIQIGYKLLLASVASQLMIGIIRFAIELKWGIIAFGKVSLPLSMANMMLTCIAAVSVVLFPALKKMERRKLADLYLLLRDLITIPLLIILVFYVPINIFLAMWLPQYKESLKYLAILMPICIYETRTQVVVYTYLKALRREAKILWVNVLSVILSTAMTVITVYLFEDLNITVFSIIVLVGVKAYCSEYYLLPFIKKINRFDLIAESCLVLISIITNWFLQDARAIMCYLPMLGVYIFIKRNDIVIIKDKLNNLSRTGEING